jgi:hypothetical protein
VTLYELKTTAITVSGLPAAELPVTIGPDEVAAFLIRNAATYWKRRVDAYAAPFREQLLLLLFPRLTEWVLLGLARQLYTLHTGAITSKTYAGQYCLTLLPPALLPVMLAAVRIRTSWLRYRITFPYAHTIRPSRKRAAATIRCARYLLGLIRDYHDPEKEGRADRHPANQIRIINAASCCFILA